MRDKVSLRRFVEAAPWIDRTGAPWCGLPDDLGRRPRSVAASGAGLCAAWFVKTTYAIAASHVQNGWGSKPQSRGPGWLNLPMNSTGPDGRPSGEPPDGSRLISISIPGTGRSAGAVMVALR